MLPEQRAELLSFAPPLPHHRYLPTSSNDCFPVAVARLQPCPLPAALLPSWVNYIANNWSRFNAT